MGNISFERRVYESEDHGSPSRVAPQKSMEIEIQALEGQYFSISQDVGSIYLIS